MNMPLPGPPAENEPPPPIIMFSTAKGMKSPSCGDGRAGSARDTAWGARVRGPSGTYQEGAALQPDHDVCELGKRGRARADIGHVSFQL